MPPRPLEGIVPPVPTPMMMTTEGVAQVDLDALADLVNFQLKAGVHGLWVLGTTGKFDLLTDDAQRAIAETVARQAGGRVPLVLNISDQGTLRTQARARLFNDLPYDYYAALPPWYQRMTAAEVADYFLSLADTLDRPLVIYNAPWVNNCLTFELLRKLAEHPRIVGCKDVTEDLGRAELWGRGEREALEFRYLHGSDQIAISTELGADGFVSALSNVVPELAVAIWDAVKAGDAARAERLQTQFSRQGMAMTLGPMLACLDAAGRHRGLFRSMLPPPLRALDDATASRVIAIFDRGGWVPERSVRSVLQAETV